MSFLRLLKYAESSRVSLILVIGLGLLGGALVAIQARLFSSAINAVFLDGRSLPDVADALGAVLTLIALRAALVWASSAAADRVARQVKTDLRLRLFDHILALGPAYTSAERTGELVNTLVEGVESLDAFFREYLPQVATAALVPLLLLLLIFPIDWISGLILLLTGPLIPLFMVLIGSLAGNISRKQWRSLSLMSAHFLDVLQGLPTLKIFGRSKAQIKVIARVSEHHRQVTMEVLRVAFLSALSLELLSTLSTALVAVGIGLRLLYGQLFFADALFVLLLAPEFYLPLRVLGARFHAGTAGLSAAERIFSILDTQLPQAVPTSPTISADTTRLENPFPIQLFAVSYTYPGSNQPALQNISFKLVPGQITALVGPSGAGKSTLVSLLLRFFQPDGGVILAGNQLVTNYPVQLWRQRLAWLPQNPYLFHDTVAANIRLARPEASLEEVVSAARKAHLHEFIETLPQKYATIIGDRGSTLSAGQAQRLALARAILKDAPVLILDEATANLDPELDEEIQKAIREIAPGRTVLLIAHRLSTAAHADQVIVLEKGKIVQQGSHAELLVAPGLYRELWAAFDARVALYDGSDPVKGSQAHSTAMEKDHSENSAVAPSPENLPEGSNNESLLRLLSSLIMPHWRAAILAVLLGVATIASSIGLMATSAYIISAAALQPSVAVLQVPIVGVRFFGISRGLFRYLERLVSHHTTFKILSELRVWFYTALEPLAPAHLLAERSGDLLSRLMADISTLENFFIRGISPTLVAALTFLGAGLLLLFFDIQLSLAFWFFFLMASAGVPMWMRYLGKAPGLALNEQKSRMNAALVDTVQGLADLLAFDTAHRLRQEISSLGQILGGAQTRLARLEGLQASLQLLIANLAMWSVTVLAIPLVRSGRLHGVFLAVAPLAALSAFEAVQPLSMAAVYLESSLQSARRLREIALRQPPLDHLDQAVTTQLNHSKHAELCVNHLTFCYPGSSRAALEDISFSLRHGERLGIVGLSGAGKSTLAALLLRFWDFSHGEIRINGTDIRSINPDVARLQLSIVSQQTHLFNASVRENLLLARPDATKIDLADACRQAQLHDFILKLPHGYETMIGEQGMRLSGGERQRVAIARALLKDSPILILDEATANLDAQTEQALVRTLLGVMQNRTVVHITHRLVGLDCLDEIIVLHEGRIVERGSLAELLALNGWLHRMWRLQHSRQLDFEGALKRR